jgi:hypothetical protein
MCVQSTGREGASQSARARIFRIEAVEKATGRATMNCRKSETRLSLTDEHSYVSAWPRPPARVAAPLNRREKAARKIRSAKIPRNPLKSLNSDERIQGNPRESNPQKRGCLKRNGREPRKPKRLDRTKVAGRRQEGLFGGLARQRRLVERLAQVLDQIVGVLEADRQSEQTRRNAKRGPLLGL